MVGEGHADGAMVLSFNMNRKSTIHFVIKVKIRLKLIGLSSMGQSQASHSLQSIADPHAPPPQGERKISFVLNDENTEGNEKDKNQQAHAPTTVRALTLSQSV